MHGDLELDNLAWAGDTPTAFDFDDAARSWFVSDIAFATRDLRTGAPDRTALLGDFVTGYRRVRPLSEADLATLPLFAAAHAAATLVRLHPVLHTDPSVADLDDLRARLVRHAGEQRLAVLRAR